MSKWDHVEAPPCAFLDHWKVSLGGFSERAGRPVRRLELPVGRDVLIIGLGEKFSVRSAFSDSTPTLRQSFVGAFQCDPQIVEHAGTQSCVQLSFPSWTSTALFGGSCTEWKGGVLDLYDLWGSAADRLAEELSEQRHWKERFHAVKHFLAVKFDSSQTRVRPELRRAWAQLENSHGRISIRALAKATGWSDRHFAARFRGQYGVLPKAAADRIRFAHAMQAMMSSESRSLADIALDCGYSDQCHLTRETRRFSGCTPCALRLARFPDLLGIPANVLGA